MEKYRNPLLIEGESVIDQNIKNTIKLIVSVVNERRKEIGGNSHAQIIPPS